MSSFVGGSTHMASLKNGPNHLRGTMNSMQNKKMSKSSTNFNCSPAPVDSYRNLPNKIGVRKGSVATVNKSKA